MYFEEEPTVTLKCQQHRQLSFCLFFPHFLQRVQGCDQYSDRQSLTPCQHLRSRASSSSVPLSISEAEFMADCPPSVTSGTVWLIWPVVLMCSGMHDAYCLPLARLSESARENVQENRDIHPSLLFFFFFFLLFVLLSSQPCLISGLSYRVVMGASPGRGLAPARAAGGINLLSLKCWKLCKCQTHPSDVLAEGGGGVWRGGGMLGGRVVDEPSTEASPPLPFVAGGCQVQMLLLAPCLWRASQYVFFFLFSLFFFFFFFFWEGGWVVWFVNIYERHKPLGAWLLSGSLVSCISLRF